MSAENWRELLDDPEVRRVVQQVDRVVPRPRDPFLADDRESYLWDKAVDIAIGYERTQVPWYGYLHAALVKSCQWHAHNLYAAGYPGDEGRARVTQRTSAQTSTEALQEARGDSWHPHSDGGFLLDIGDEEAAGREHWPDAPGYYRLSRHDPLLAILRAERYESADRHLRARQAQDGHWTTASNDLCSDVTCWERATRRGMCDTHYRRWRSRWADTPSCSVGECAQPSITRGMCGSHYQAWRRQDPTAPRCLHLGCDRAGVAHGRCQYHARLARQREAS